MSAFLSPCGRYRYSLTRDVAPLTGSGTVAFVMLNPSTADAEKDDPTTRRCADFARTWGFERLKIVNLYAYRATDPRELGSVDDPVGPENVCTVAKVVGGADLVVCAWGANAPPAAAEVYLELIAAPHCLGRTVKGAPLHPLRLRRFTMPVPFAHCPDAARWAA